MVENPPFVNFGIKYIDGTPTRVAADDADANIVLSGKFHSTQHGWANFSSTVAVPGPVKISMGACRWGGTVTIKKGNEVVGSFATTMDHCYHEGKDTYVASFVYKGEAATLTIAGGSYTPYIAVEYIDPATLVTDITLSFSTGTAEGTAPAAIKAEPGTAITLPANRTLYAEGKTLVAWTDGTNEYPTGSEISAPAEDVTLTPVFRDNTYSLNDRLSPVTVVWDFQKKNGAPELMYQGKVGFYVTQTTVNGETIDVKCDFDASTGKIANGSWPDWCQMNESTTFSLPACEGAIYTVEAYSAPNLTIDGNKGYAAGKVINYVLPYAKDNVNLVIGNEGSYYRYIKVVLPYVENAYVDYSGVTLPVDANFDNTNVLVVNAEGVSTNANAVTKSGNSHSAATITITDGNAFHHGKDIAADVTYSRANANQYVLAILPFEVDITGIDAYTLSAASDEALKFVSVGANIPAYTPVLIDAKKADVALAGMNIAAVSATKIGDFYVGDTGITGWKYAFTTETVVVEDVAASDLSGYEIYGVSNDAFVHATRKMTTRPFRTFFLCEKASAAQLKASLRIDIADDVTGIETISTETEADAPRYNVLGVPVVSNYRGVVIMNGKKTIVK